MHALYLCEFKALWKMGLKQFGNVMNMSFEIFLKQRHTMVIEDVKKL